ncbi:MAG: ABC transporter permease subunit [Christensenella sp.]
MYGVQIAFKYFSPRLGIWGSEWVGFDNFTRFFDSYYFWRIIRNTITLSVYNLIVGFPFPIILALVFNEIKSAKLKKVVQTISYAPHFVSIVVMVGILNLFFNQSNGLVNTIMAGLGMERFGFLTSSAAFPSMYVWSGVWQNAGWASIIYIAALTSIDPQLHEAAQIDGASRLKRIIHINIPCILPTAIIMFILDVGQIMNMGFEKVFLMQNAQNIETSQVISTFVYESGLINSDYGFSTAIGLFNNIINIILLLSVNKIAKRFGDTSLF